jgi:molybdopterin-guanine dinucleotide biosynthesis protein A
MGSAKQHISVRGQSMGQTAIALGTACCEIVVISGPGEAMPGHPHVADLRPHAGLGPLAGIEAVLASGLADRWIIIPCDMPGLHAGTLRQLGDSPAPVACLGQPHRGAARLQLPLAVNAALLTSVRDFLDGGGRRIGDWLDAENAQIIAEVEESQVQNVNRPEDLPEPP